MVALIYKDFTIDNIYIVVNELFNFMKVYGKPLLLNYPLINHLMTGVFGRWSLMDYLAAWLCAKHFETIAQRTVSVEAQFGRENTYNIGVCKFDE